jgi:hypothetical protein
VTPDEMTLAVIDALEAAAIPYLIVGSLSSNFHGVPRATQDADFVIDIAAGAISRLANALPSPVTIEAQAGFETVTGSVRYVVVSPGSPFVCEIFALSEDPHDVERMRRRLRVSLLGRQTFVATAEDTIITKLRWAVLARRGKDVDDVRNIIAVRGDELDWSYLRHWTAAHGSTALLEEIRRSIPPDLAGGA